MAATCAVAVVLALAACGGSSSGGSAGGSGSSGKGGNTWVQGILQPKGDSGYQLMAKARNFYKQEGVNVQIKTFVGNVQLVQALLSGAIDSGDTAPDPIYAAALKGANVKIIGSTLPKVTYALIAKSSITSLKQLQGKTIGASAPGAYPEAVVEAMLAKEGLDPHSVQVVATGSDAQRFQALVAGRIDAAAVSDQFVPVAEKNPKIHLLAEAQSVIPDYPRFYLAANGKSLASKPKTAVRFLAGEMKGLCYAVTHPAAERQVVGQNIGKSPNDPQIVYAQKDIAKAHAASPDSAIPMGPLNFLQTFRVQKGLQHGKVDLSKLVDSSYRQKALKLAHLPKPCLTSPTS